MADYSKTAETLIYLISCAVNKKKCELKPGELDFDGLYLLAKRHFLCAAVSFALESAGIEERRFTQARLKSMRKLGLFDIERGKICEKLNEAGIWYLPLKGIVIKDFYPEFGMREMSDNDILCDASKMAQVREIMEAFGYECEEYGLTNHDNYKKLPTLEFEMHRLLFEKDAVPEFDAYYENIIEKAVRKENCEYALTDEDFYIYILAHTYKHFTYSGTGLRPLLDIYVYLKSHTELDFDYIRRELEILKIEKFERKCRELSLKLFGFQPLSGEDTELLSEFLYSSLYGSVAQWEYNGLTRSLDGKDTKGAKTKYLLDRTFISGKALEKQYPFFARHKLLLPALYIYRPVKGIIKRPKYILREVKKVIKYKSPKNRL